MTLREWQEADWKTRLFYRLYRNPLILIPIGGIFVYALRYRWPKNTMKVGPAGVLAHDALLLGWIGLLYWLGESDLNVNTPILLKVTQLQPKRTTSAK